MMVDKTIDEDEQYDDIAICNLGSSNVAAGFAGDDAPRAVFPAIIGRPKVPAAMAMFGARSHFVGDDAQARRGILRITRPIEGGHTLTSADDMEMLLQHTLFNELRVDPTTTPLVLVVHPLMDGRDRDALCDIAMNRLKVPRFWLLEAPLMALLTQGLTSGIALHIGGHSTYCAAVFEGSVLTSTIFRSTASGSAVRDRLVDSLNQSSSCGFKTAAELAIVDDLKETLCAVNTQPNRMPKEEKEYELPAGNVIQLGSESIFGPPEILFETTSQSDSIVKLVEQALEQCPKELRQEIASNGVVLSGNSSRFRGLAERLELELRYRSEAAAQPSNEEGQAAVATQACCVRRGELYASFVGASIAVMDLLQRNGGLAGCMVEAATYEAHGPSAGRWMRL